MNDSANPIEANLHRRCDSERPRFNVSFLWTATSLTAIWLALYPVTSLGSKFLLAVYALTYLFGCWKTRRGVLWLLPASYLPYMWLLADWANWPWSNYRWQWIAILWQLPGLCVAAVVHPLPEAWFQIITAATTYGMFFCALLISRRNARVAFATSGVIFLLSCLNSLFAYAAYRS